MITMKLLRKFKRSILKKELLSSLEERSFAKRQKSSAYLEWLSSDLVGLVEEYVRGNCLVDSAFIKTMNQSFKTARFVLLLKKWLVEYFFRLFGIIDDHVQTNAPLVLADIRINRFAVEKYISEFGKNPAVKWKRRPGLLLRLFDLTFIPLIMVFFSLNKGLRFGRRRKSFKVMREALWGLKDVGGYNYHDDFFVDGEKIKKKDLLLFSRGIPTESGRLKGYHDARESDYSHFVPEKLPLEVRRYGGILLRYVILPMRGLIKLIKDENYLVYFSLLMYFANHALKYEKVFSNFELGCELGHDFFSPSHIAEAIVCQYYGAKYYLFHWSDNSVTMNSYISSFLGCDKYLIWGSKHVRGVEGSEDIFMLTGYAFKRFIKKIAFDRGNALLALGIAAKGKIITFFDESFGGDCKMTAEHYVDFWRTALELAQVEANNTIVIKPKEIERFKQLPEEQKTKFLEIKGRLEKLSNVYIAESDKWSFIEYIGISDIVVTLGMTSSATIAIICGIEGLYFDPAEVNHPFSRMFKDRIVFADSEKLIAMIHSIMVGKASQLKNIPEEIIRGYDTYADDRGLDLFRKILSGEKEQEVVKIGNGFKQRSLSE